MKLAFVFTLASVLIAVSSRRVISIEYSDESDDDAGSKSKSKGFDVNGRMRKKFAIAAASMDPGHSMICSPLSALIPLGKLAMGADGRAHHELLAAIGSKSTSQVKQDFGSIIETLQGLPGVILNIASKIYVSDREELKSEFDKNARSVFKSSVERVDFNRPREVSDAINNWVATETENKISDITNPNDISPSSSMILVNAIYFQGAWVNKFQRSRTRPFYSPDGVQEITMMTSHNHYRYIKSKDLGAQIVELPYEGGRASFVLILPDDKRGLPLLLSELKLAPELLDKALRSMRTVKLELSIPKFKIETEMNLGALYQKIGVREIFEGGNGLNGIVSSGPVFVSKAKQKAIIEVNEFGTKAAAATVTSIMLSSFLPHKLRVNADHPFQFFILVNRQQLFAGTFSGDPIDKNVFDDR